MSEPFLGEIRAFAFSFPPRGWAFCDGQEMSIMQNQALFSLLGTTYGGNGQTTFRLPDLRGRVPVHPGDGITLGESSGEEGHTLTIQEMPQHTHVVSGSSQPPSSPLPDGHVWASAQGVNNYSQEANVLMSQTALKNTGGSQPHENRQPYSVLNYCIAIMGIYPTRN
ncbi:tail fiber protein [Brevibacillus humidisoli]|uniref:phage tail protein n=1 Tax=Brevibacillus humidisoli TaxID=2895522 RepID=UPI001E56FE0B|nr:tail fiber protein [Brevibacillus humidisoli]UFJ39581.1 tail fiber protein [Brevibacillus humidisoli]